MGNIKILKASAGSGKTYQLAYAYIRNVIRDPGRYRHILAVTFTNKATEEMKQRIISEINRLACGAPDGYLPELVRDLELPPDTIRRRAREARTRILHDYSHFTIVTIDKFFQRIIRSFIKELGIDINFNLELQTDPLLDTAADRLIEAIATDDKLRKWIVRFAEEQIDRNGKWDVRSEIVALGRELFREQYKTLQSEPVTPEKLTAVVGEAIARSRAVKDEMRRTASEALAVIADAGLRPEDFAYGRQGCTGYLTRINNGEIVPYGKRVQDALGSDDKWVSAKSPHRAKILSLVPQLRGLFGRLCETFDRNFRFLNTTRLLQTNYRSFALLNNLNEKIAEVCAEQHLIPISETNSIINKLIAGNDTPFIYEKTGNTFSHFMIDEFQDTSSQQWQNFVPLLENAVAQQDEFPVLLVGDVKQSIYRWRGGDWQILGRKVREAFGQIAEQTLDTNYRSSGTIVAFNNNLIERCVRSANESLNRLLDASAGEGTISASLRRELTDMLAEAYSDLKQKQHRAPQAGYVRITAYDPPEEETARTPVIETVEELQRRGYAPGDIAVLVRTNAQGVAVARQLLDYKASRPDTPYCYDVVTQEALQIGNSDTVGFIIAVLQIASSPDDRIRRTRAHGSAGCGCFPSKKRSAKSSFSTGSRRKKTRSPTYRRWKNRSTHSELPGSPISRFSCNGGTNRDAPNRSTCRATETPSISSRYTSPKDCSTKPYVFPTVTGACNPKRVVCCGPEAPKLRSTHWSTFLSNGTKRWPNPTFRKPISAKRFSPKSITSTCSTWRRPAPKRNCTSSSPGARRRTRRAFTS